MTKETHGYRIVPRSMGVSSQYALLVVDRDGMPYLPPTRFYHEMTEILVDQTDGY